MDVNKHIFNQNNLYAWCIVPFDKLNRTPSERIKMLKELGFNSYGYDWRNEHIPTMEEEFLLAKENNISIKCVWMWIDGNYDNINNLSDWNEELLHKIKNVDLRTSIWLGFHPNFFNNLSEDDAVNKGTAMIEFLNRKADSIGCEIALYNHGDWFGEPENQIKIIEKLKTNKVGMVYNLHHGHEQIDRFPQLLKIMMPYLIAVNINGMNPDGPKILPIGSGSKDKEMLNELINSGYKGPVGILGHIEDEDVKIVLQRNLDGLKEFQ
ncbi:MAG: AP endonuclease [Ignavibacteriae bacterium]|nr:AP endonuclease [Ignavibacteriota bacterium]